MGTFTIRGVLSMLLSRAHSAQKGAFLGPASQEGIAILFPDTSPRGAGIEGEDDDWDFGTGMCRSPEFTGHALTTSSGAGFYLNATNPKYAKHYNMLNHVTIEIPEVVEAAGLPIVRPPLSVGMRALVNARFARRTSVASRSSDIPWADTAR